LSWWLPNFVFRQQPHCLPPISFFQHHKIQGETLLLGRFQLRSDLSHAWLPFPFVSDMQKRVHNLALLKDLLWRLTDTIMLTTTYILFLTLQNKATNNFSGSIPTEIGSITYLGHLNFCKSLANTVYNLALEDYWL
jgi:hypothetical protein